MPKRPNMALIKLKGAGRHARFITQYLFEIISRDHVKSVCRSQPKLFYIINMRRNSKILNLDSGTGRTKQRKVSA